LRVILALRKGEGGMMGGYAEKEGGDRRYREGLLGITQEVWQQI